MAGETYQVAGRIEFSGKLKGTRAEIEKRMDDLMMELCLVGKERDSDLTFSSPPISLYQKLSGWFKV